ncbi:MAG: hypothetical protein ACKV2V_24940 [Blastocatellia bacterium]
MNNLFFGLDHRFGHARPMKAILSPGRGDRKLAGGEAQRNHRIRRKMF